MAGPAHKNDDDALLRRLYDEPAADDAEVDSLRRVRSAVAEYARATDVEPPSRGLDELMAAARARVAHAAAAVAPVATPGFWARARAWFAPIARHPALASGAAVVLIGGLAGVLYLKAGVTGAEHEAPSVAYEQGSLDDKASTAPAVAAVPPAAEAGSGQGLYVSLDDDRGETKAADEPAAGKRPDSKPDRPAVRPPADRAGGDVAKLDDRSRGLGGGGAATGDHEDVTGVGRGGRYTNEPAANGTAGTQKQLEPAAPDPARVKQRPAAKDPAPAPAAPGADDGLAIASDGDEDHDAAETTGTATAKGESARPPEAPTQPRGPSLDQLTRQARTAARSGDCGVVKTLARRVRAASADYYKRSFAPDADIKKCL